MMSPRIVLEPRTRQPYDSPSRRLISPSARTLSHLVRQLGALVRYVVFIVNVVVGTNGPSIPLPSSIPLNPLSSLPLPLGAAYPYPDLQYIFVDFSTRIKTCAADPLCFYFRLSIRLLVTIPSC